MGLSLLQISSVNIIPGEITYDAVENIGMYYKEGSINHVEQQKPAGISFQYQGLLLGFPLVSFDRIFSEKHGNQTANV